MSGSINSDFICSDCADTYVPPEDKEYKCQDCNVSICKDCVKGSKELDEYFCTKCE